MDKEFAGYKIVECEISETTDGKRFEFKLKKSGKKIEAAIDFDGKVLKKENEESQKEDND